MSVYCAAFRSPPFLLTGSPVFELICSATDTTFVDEIAAFCAGTTSSLGVVLGVGRPAAKGVGAKASAITFVAEDLAPLGGVSVAVNWATAPTSPSRFLQRQNASIGTVSVNGGYFLFRFRGLVITPGNSLVLWCINTSNAFQVLDCDVRISA